MAKPQRPGRGNRHEHFRHVAAPPFDPHYEWQGEHYEWQGSAVHGIEEAINPGACAALPPSAPQTRGADEPLDASTLGMWSTLYLLLVLTLPFVLVWSALVPLALILSAQHQ